MVIIEESESLSSEEKEQINTGLEAGKAIAEFIKSKAFSHSMTKIGSSLSIYLGALGPFMGAVLAFIPSESDELSFMKNMMTQIDNRFDAMDTRFEDIERLIDWNAVRVNFGQIEQKILAMSDEYEYIYKVPQDALENRKTLFLSSYDSDYQNSGTKLYTATVQPQGTFQENLGDSVRRYTKNDRKKTQEFLLGVMQLLLQAAKIELAYLNVKSFDANALFMKTQWEERIQSVKTEFERVDNAVISKYHEQFGVDLVDFAAANTGMNNQDFATALYNMLSGKYYWRHWVVLAYISHLGTTHCNDMWGTH